MFAIALTLLVVEVGVPSALPGADDDPEVLLDAIGDRLPLIASFFVGCIVIGSYWAAHHRFLARLGAVDGGYVGLTVLYLACVAFLPFPTGLLGEFHGNPISVVAFALNMAAVSGMEVALLRHAWRRGLFKQDLPADVYRWARDASSAPVLLFALSVPIAFVHTWLAVAVWFLSWPLQTVRDRRRPAEFDRYFGSQVETR